MRIVFSTACLAQRLDQAAALGQLRAADLRPIELGDRPGDLTKPDPAIVAAHLAFLPTDGGRINLAAGDDDLRRQGVRAVTEALARCEWLGIPLYQVIAGWNLEQTLPRNGQGPPAPLPEARRPHAVAQLERSLDRLAAEASDRGLTLGVVNMPGHCGGLLSRPGEIRQVLRTVDAPNLRLSLDLGALAAAARQGRRFDPDEAAVSLQTLSCALRVPPWDRRPEAWIAQVCAATELCPTPDGCRTQTAMGNVSMSPIEPLPVILGAKVPDAAKLHDLAAVFEEALHAPA